MLDSFALSFPIVDTARWSSVHDGVVCLGHVFRARIGKSSSACLKLIYEYMHNLSKHSMTSESRSD